jgi:hypothetical protein
MACYSLGLLPCRSNAKEIVHLFSIRHVLGLRAAVEWISEIMWACCEPSIANRVLPIVC